jgi:hypothetical protein
MRVAGESPKTAYSLSKFLTSRPRVSESKSGSTSTCRLLDSTIFRAQALSNHRIPKSVQEVSKQVKRLEVTELRKFFVLKRAGNRDRTDDLLITNHLLSRKVDSGSKWTNSIEAYRLLESSSLCWARLKPSASRRLAFCCEAEVLPICFANTHVFSCQDGPPTIGLSMSLNRPETR